MLLIPVVVVTVASCGVGVVTGPVTVVSVERSPPGPTTTVLGVTPAVESDKVSKTALAVRPRQLNQIVIGVSEGSMLVVAGGNVYLRVVPGGKVIVREVGVPVPPKSMLTV